MKLSAILAPLIAAKADHELIMAQIVAFEKEQESTVDQGKEKARARWHKWNDKRLQTLANVSGPLTRGDTRGEDNLLPKKITGQEENKKEAAPKALSDLDAFKADLMHDASAEQVEAFVKHRKAKNGQNSAYSAKLFRRDAAACNLSVSGAIDMAVSRGWLTVKPEYLTGTRRGNGQGPPQEIRTIGELAIHRLETGQSRNEPTGYANGRMDQGDGRGQAESPRGAQLIAFAAKSFGRIE